MECHSKWIVTENKISKKKMSPKIEFHLKKMPLKIKCQSKLNVT